MAKRAHPARGQNRDDIRRISASPLSRGDDSGAYGISWLRLSDERNFQEILYDWILAIGTSDRGLQVEPSFEAACKTFLNKTGLTNHLSIDELGSLLDGTRVPGKRLARYLALVLSAEVGQEQCLPTPFVFRSRAMHALAQSMRAVAKDAATPSPIELDDEQYAALRAPLFKRLLANTLPGKASSDDEESAAVAAETSSHPFTHRLVRHVQFLESGANENEILEQLSKHYRTNPQELLDVLYRLFTDQNKAALRSWAEMELKPLAEYHGPGRLLWFLRQSAGLLQREVAERIGMDATVICNWETGKYPIGSTKLHLLYGALHPSIDEMAQFTHLIRPDLDSAWIKEQLGPTGNVEYLSWPALDPNYKVEHVGQLVRAHRQRCGLTLKQLAEQTGIDVQAIRHCEKRYGFGRHSLIAKKLPGLRDALALSSDEYVRLLKTEWPVLDPVQLEAVPEHRRGGQLMGAYRKILGLEQQDLAEKLDMERISVAQMEAGRRPISNDRLDQLCTLFRSINDAKAAPFDEDTFRQTCQRSGEIIRQSRSVKNAGSSLGVIRPVHALPAAQKIATDKAPPQGPNSPART
jgi:transcriptional regulator with XRE-family HTH domain